MDLVERVEIGVYGFNVEYFGAEFALIFILPSMGRLFFPFYYFINI